MLVGGCRLGGMAGGIVYDIVGIDMQKLCGGCQKADDGGMQGEVMNSDDKSVFIVNATIKAAIQ